MDDLLGVRIGHELPMQPAIAAIPVAKAVLEARAKPVAEGAAEGGG